MPETARSDPASDTTRMMAKAEAAKLLRRVGFPHRVISNILRDLPDPVDVDRLDPKLVGRYGLTSEQLMDRLGGSP